MRIGENIISAYFYGCIIYDGSEKQKRNLKISKINLPIKSACWIFYYLFCKELFPSSFMSLLEKSGHVFLNCFPKYLCEQNGFPILALRWVFSSVTQNEYWEYVLHLAILTIV